jgi:branched-chain amino acid transport system permease protein
MAALCFCTNVNLTLLAQSLVNGLLFGGVYSLMAVGLSLIFGVMRVINFAHGDMMVWGMYLAFLLSVHLGVDPYFSFALCAAVLFATGLAIQRGLVNRIMDAPHEMQILLMLGVALVLENVALVAFGPDTRRVSTPLGATALWFGPLFFDLPRLLTFAFSIALSLGLWLFLYRSDLGRTIRAASDNPTGALVVGADVNRVYTVAFGVGSGLVGAAGALTASFLPFSPAAGLAFTVASFNIVIIGGMGSLVGAFLGGLLVSVAESIGAVVLAPSLKEVVSFSLLILILLFRPSGLFGKRV